MKIDKNDDFLLKEIILEHYQNPSYWKVKQDELKKSKVFFNSSCGDQVSFQIKIENNLVQDLSFSGKGCALTIASTDILCSQIIHQDLATSLKILTNFFHLVTGQESHEDELDELLAFWTLPQHLNRLNCVLLGINGLKETILEKGGENGQKTQTNHGN